MAIKIITTRTSTQDYDLGHFSIDLARKTAVLIRQSMKKADKDHYESRLLQENLVPIAIRLRGETDDTNILIFDEGAGVSGTKGYDERPKLSALYLAIANDIVGSLLVARPDRLFRDKHFLNVGMFTELAERKRLILIVPGKRIYDFTKYADLQAFQRDMHDSYNYIATHIKYMNDTRLQKVQRGLYGGWFLPAPYVVDKNVWKDEQVPIIYAPWVAPAIDLYTRFKEYDFSIAHIARYIEDLPYIFPSPSFEDTKRYLFKTNMRLVPGGYTLSHIDKIKYYLSNLTLGGYAKVGKDEDGNELLLPNAFEAAIPFDLLDASYAAITGHHIDGTSFEGKKDVRKHMRKNPEGIPALLHGILTSDNGTVSIASRESTRKPTEDEKTIYLPIYLCKKGLQEEGRALKSKLGIVTQQTAWTLRCEWLDQAVLGRLYDLAEHDDDMADRVKSFFDSRKKKGEDEGALLRRQIGDTQQRIKRLDYLLKNPNIPLDETTATKYASELAELNPKLARLIKKQRAQPDIDPEKTITGFYFVLAHLAIEFEKQDTETQKQMMRRLIKQATVNLLSPHLYSLYIIWQEGIAIRPDVALIWRGSAKQEYEEWSEDEDTILKTYYPCHPQLEVMRLLPRHSWAVIIMRAMELQVTRNGQRVNDYHKTVCYADLAAALQYTEEIGDEAYICEIINELAKQTQRGEINAYWPLPLEIVGFAKAIRIEEDQWSRRRRSPR